MVYEIVYVSYQRVSIIPFRLNLYCRGRDKNA